MVLEPCVMVPAPQVVSGPVARVSTVTNGATEFTVNASPDHHGTDPDLTALTPPGVAAKGLDLSPVVLIGEGSVRLSLRSNPCPTHRGGLRPTIGDGHQTRCGSTSGTSKRKPRTSVPPHHSPCCTQPRGMHTSAQGTLGAAQERPLGDGGSSGVTAPLCSGAAATTNIIAAPPSSARKPPSPLGGPHEKNNCVQVQVQAQVQQSQMAERAQRIGSFVAQPTSVPNEDLRGEGRRVAARRREAELRTMSVSSTSAAGGAGAGAGGVRERGGSSPMILEGRGLKEMVDKSKKMAEHIYLLLHAQTCRGRPSCPCPYGKKCDIARKIVKHINCRKARDDAGAPAEHGGGVGGTGLGKPGGAGSFQEACTTARKLLKHFKECSHHSDGIKNCLICVHVRQLLHKNGNPDTSAFNLTGETEATCATEPGSSGSGSMPPTPPPPHLASHMAGTKRQPIRYLGPDPTICTPQKLHMHRAKQRLGPGSKILALGPGQGVRGSGGFSCGFTHHTPGNRGVSQGYHLGCRDAGRVGGWAGAGVTAGASSGLMRGRVGGKDGVFFRPMPRARSGSWGGYDGGSISSRRMRFDSIPEERLKEEEEDDEQVPATDSPPTAPNTPSPTSAKASAAAAAAASAASMEEEGCATAIANSDTSSDISSPSVPVTGKNNNIHANNTVSLSGSGSVLEVPTSGGGDTREKTPPDLGSGSRTVPLLSSALSL